MRIYRILFVYQMQKRRTFCCWTIVELSSIIHWIVEFQLKITASQLYVPWPFFSFLLDRNSCLEAQEKKGITRLFAGAPYRGWDTRVTSFFSAGLGFVVTRKTLPRRRYQKPPDRKSTLSDSSENVGPDRTKGWEVRRTGMAASERGGKGKRRLMPAIDNVVWARAPGSMQLRSERGKKSPTRRSEREKMGRGRSDKWVTKRQQRGTRGGIESTEKTRSQTEGGEAEVEWHELIAVERLKLTIP